MHRPHIWALQVDVLGVLWRNIVRCARMMIRHAKQLAQTQHLSILQRATHGALKRTLGFRVKSRAHVARAASL